MVHVKPVLLNARLFIANKNSRNRIPVLFCRFAHTGRVRAFTHDPISTVSACTSDTFTLTARLITFRLGNCVLYTNVPPIKVVRAELTNLGTAR